MIVIDPEGKKHSVPDNYDNKELIFTPDKTWQEMKPTDILSRTGYNFNQLSTRVNEQRPTTMKITGPSVRADGTRIGTRKAYNW